MAFHKPLSAKILLFFVFAYFPIPTSAQPNLITFEHITVEDGLAHNRVWHILQDSKGFLWLATGYGLSRYDGYKFTNFRQGGESTLSRDAVWAVYEDHAGTIWAGTYGGGLNKFDAATQTFRHFLHDPQNPNSLSNNVVRAIHELSDEPGVLWIATVGGGLNRFDTRTETFINFRHDPSDPSSLASNSVHALYESKDGTLWLGTGNGFSQLIRPRNSKTANASARDASESISFRNYRFKPDENPLDLYTGGVTAILESKDGTLWLGANAGGLSRFDAESETYVHYTHDPDDPKSLSRGSVRALREDAAGAIWIGTYGGGLNRFDRATRTFTHYTYDPDDPHSLSNNVVRDIFEDRSGVMWIATFGGGLNKVVRTRFAHLRHEPNNFNSLSHNNVKKIDEDLRGRIWVIMQEGGLTRIDMNAEGTTYTHYEYDPNNSNSLGQNSIISMIESRDKPGVFWLRTANRGLNRFDSNTNSFVRFEHDPDNPNSLSSNRISTIHQSLQEPAIFWIGAARGHLNRLETRWTKFTRFDLGTSSLLEKIHESPREPGVLWIGTLARGLIRFDSENKTFQHILQEDTVANIPAHIEMIHESPKRLGILWVTTDREGFYKIVHHALKNETNIKKFRHQPGDPNSLASDKLWAFCETDDGVLWFGTEKGLSRFDPETETFTNYTTAHGLPGDFIQSMLPDDNGHIWVATNGGLSRFTPVTEHFRSYSVSDGLQGNSFNVGAFAKGRDGTLYFGGVNGLNVFHPDSIRDNPHIPPVVFTDFQIFNKPVKIDRDKADEDQTLPGHISTLAQIVLSHRENVFSFEFAALDYAAPEQNQYAYKMEGFHKDWIDAGTNRTASFTNLDQGEYTFRVKGSNNDGVWNEQGASLQITILMPWWRTWWAYSLYVGFIVLTLYGLRRFEKNRQQFRHEAELQKVDHLKSRFFANISHEFRTPLTLIMGQIDALQSEQLAERIKEKLAMASRNAGQLLTLINQLLDLSKFEAGQMTLRASQQNIVPLLRRTVASFESWAAQKRIALQFETSHDEILLWYEQEKIEKVIVNLLSNALKFTPGGGSVKVAVAGSSGEGERVSGRWGEREKGGTGVDSATHPIPSFLHHPLSHTPSLEIQVRDSGIGIPHDRLLHIFDRFYQVDSSQTREFEGTGIGLALAQELVQLHGGGISVQSAEGFGATFTVTLPLGNAHLKPEQMVEPVDSGQYSEISDRDSDKLIDIPPSKGGEEPVSPFEGELREMSKQSATSIEQPATEDQQSKTPSIPGDFILIVEDNADMRAFIGENLRNKYRIVEAANGEEGFAKAQEYIPDLIITDVMMSRVDGYEMTRRIRQDQVTCHIPIIMLTAKAADEDKFEGLEQGVDAYLTKPFNKKELRIRVRKLIELRRQLRQRAGVKAVLTPSEIEASSMDQEFLQRVQEIIEKKMGNENFSVDDLAGQIGMGKRQLQRKLKALTDSSPQQCIRTMRLQRAKQLLEQNAGTVSEVAFQVGYSEGSALARAFREEFGFVPTDLISRKGK